jgi:Mn-dependent DtxR family transcriptional regulator
MAVSHTDEAYLDAVGRLHTTGTTDECGGVTSKAVATDLNVPQSTAVGRLKALADKGRLDEQWCPSPRPHRSYTPASV